MQTAVVVVVAALAVLGAGAFAATALMTPPATVGQPMGGGMGPGMGGMGGTHPPGMAGGCGANHVQNGATNCATTCNMQMNCSMCQVGTG